MRSDDELDAAGSVVRKDLLGPDPVVSVDSTSPGQSSVLADGVVGGPGAAGSAGLETVPDHLEGVADANRGPFLDSPGDDPLNRELAPLGGLDREHPRVFDASRIDPIHDVGPDQAVLVGGPGNETPPEGEGEHEHQAETSHAEHRRGAPSASAGDQLSLLPGPFGRGTLTAKGRRRLRVAAAVAILMVVAVVAFAIFEPIQVLPRIRLAPGYALTNQDGRLITSEDARGSVVLYAFTHVDCPEPCFEIDATMAEIQERVASEVDLGEVDFRMITVSFDAEHDTPERLAEAAAAVGADPAVWQWAVPDPGSVDHLIRSGFKTYFEPTEDGFRFDPRFLLVDGWGVVRGDYRYQTLASDSDRIVRHVGILGEELRNSHGVASVAYEAAHLFLCYP